MMKVLIAVVVLALFSHAPAAAQVAYSEDHFRVFDGNGKPSSLEEVIKALDATDVVFLGEEHDDAVGHAIESEIFKRAVAQYTPTRNVALSLEMFERDVQIVLDEYLAGLITEQQFLSSSRPWPNYKTDYRPVVEFAKDKHLSVVAANAPRRYVNMVSRNGRDALNHLSKQAKAWIAPLPYGEPSAAYAAKFRTTMADRPEATNLEFLLSAQALWDATMANSVANYLSKNNHSLVVHLNGGFHTESRLGIVEHLLKYRPKTRVLVVTMHRSDDFKTFDKAKDTGLGDFVILTARLEQK